MGEGWGLPVEGRQETKICFSSASLPCLVCLYLDAEIDTVHWLIHSLDWKREKKLTFPASLTAEVGQGTQLWPRRYK